MTQDGLIDPEFQDPELRVPMDHFPERISTSTSSRITVEPYIPIS